MISFPEMLLRLVLALVLGALIGIERESHEHAAGLRTNALVALGSSLFMIISAYGFTGFLGISHIQVDPSRVASYVVAGIGFLGAGAIFRSSDRDKVRGLTTAAAIWVVAAIGLACGIGLLWEAIAATVIVLAVLILLRLLERSLLSSRSAGKRQIRIEAASVTGEFIGEVYNTFARTGITVEKLGVRSAQEIETVELACRVHDTKTLARVIGELRGLPGVQAVHAHGDDTG